MIFSWLRNRRRKRIVAEPYPEDWRGAVHEKLPYVAALPEPSQEELFQMMQVFLAEKHIEGCAGFEITEEVRITIAAQACVLLLHRETDQFPKLKTILVYETAFYDAQDYEDEDGIVTEYDDVRAGESWDIGVVILAWQEIVRGLRRHHDGYNVILHEFAHQLDHENRETDGIPILDERSFYPRWQEVFSEEYERLLKDVSRNRKTVLDDYGATNPAEFFAVATESFFEESDRLRDKHPDLYAVLKRYYKQDPAHYWESAKNGGG